MGRSVLSNCLPRAKVTRQLLSWAFREANEPARFHPWRRRAVTRPFAAAAQEPAGMRRIGVLMGYSESDSEAQLELAAFVQELEKLGWADHGNLRTDIRWV